jgi:hypothetical protein
MHYKLLFYDLSYRHCFINFNIIKYCNIIIYNNLSKDLCKIIFIKIVFLIYYLFKLFFGF